MTPPTLYAVPGWGSAIVEVGYALAGRPLRRDVLGDVTEPDRDRDRLLALNPLGQLPVLILADGTVLTESTAILLDLADRAPEAELVPPTGDPTRPLFWRWLQFLAGNVYPTWTYADFPERYVPAAAADHLVRTIRARREDLLRVLDGAAADGPWFLGARRTLIDCYLLPMSYWRPGSDWWRGHVPRLWAVAERMKADPVVAPVVAQNDPH